MMCLVPSGCRKDGEVAEGSIYSLASRRNSFGIRIRADSRLLHAAWQAEYIDNIDGPSSTHMRYNPSTRVPGLRSREVDAHCHPSKTGLWPLIRPSARVR